VEIRPLRESDDRSRFSCGDDELDRFFRRYAGQNQFRHHLGVSYVAVEGPALLGFVTVAPGELRVDAAPVRLTKRMPRYPLPVLRLARLAVDRRAQRRGVGTRLLRFVLDLSVRLAHDFGCVGVLVDAKPDAVDFYYRYGFEPLEPLEGAAQSRPSPTPMFLSVAAIEAARR
jgi:GNAT superfamily N-acetyltransferase